MKLNFKNREKLGKGTAKRLRREAQIPAIVYDLGKESKPVVISEEEFSAALRSTVRGHLPTTVFTLTGEDGQSFRAVVKDIEYHKTTYQILHLDFERLLEDKPVNVKVPIEFSGEDACVGVKLGGVLRPVIRYCRVSCPSEKIPASFKIEVSDLGMRSSKRISDIVMAEGIKPLVDTKQVCVTVAKR